MRKPSMLFLGAFTLGVGAQAQSQMELVLADIAKNNKTMVASVQHLDAQKRQFNTGITPDNPTVEYDFLSGSPAGAGNQHDLVISQAFEFPTVYIKKAQLAKQQSSQAEIQLVATRQNVLMEAKKVCIELVYRNKLQMQLTQQKQNVAKLLSNFQTKLDRGDGTMLDVNKVKLQMIEVNKQHQDNAGLITQLGQQLTSLNGGNLVVFVDTVYPITPNMPPFEQLEAEYESADPMRKMLEQEKGIIQKQLELTKAQWLPKMEAGFHYQGILGQTYKGVHTGLSIPLWADKGKVNAQKSNLIYSDLEFQNHRNEHYYAIKQLYEKYGNLKIMVAEYKQLFASLNTIALLNKAIDSGQISTIDYFTEANYHNTAFSNFLQTEMEYQTAIAELYKYKF